MHHLFKRVHLEVSIFYKGFVISFYEINMKHQIVQSIAKKSQLFCWTNELRWENRSCEQSYKTRQLRHKESSGWIPSPAIPRIEARVGSRRMSGSADIRFPAHCCPPALIFPRHRCDIFAKAGQNSYSVSNFSSFCFLESSTFLIGFFTATVA